MKHSIARRNLIARQSGEHRHDFAQILIGLKGKMTCEFNTESDQLLSGKLAIVPESEAHLFSGLNDDSELLVIDLAPFDPYIQALEHSCNLSFSQTILNNPEFITLSPEVVPMVDFAANQLAKREQQVDQQRRQQINCQLITLFMTQLCQQYSASTTHHDQSRLNRQQLNRYIDQRLAAPPTNGAIAKALNISESHLYTLCQQELGLTPQQYTLSRRMARARFLLQNSDITQTILADELGFADASSFSRAFKRYFKMTPGYARQRQR